MGVVAQWQTTDTVAKFSAAFLSSLLLAISKCLQPVMAKLWSLIMVFNWTSSN